MTTQPATDRLGSGHLKQAVTAVIDALTACGLGVSHLTCVFGAEVYAVPSPIPDPATAKAVFEALDAPAPVFKTVADDDGTTHRLMGPVPGLGLRRLSITIDPLPGAPR